MSTPKGFVVVGDAVVEAAGLPGTVVVAAAVGEVATDVPLVGGVVTVVEVGPVVATVDGMSVACPVVEQATISSRDQPFSRIGTP